MKSFITYQLADPVDYDLNAEKVLTMREHGAKEPDELDWRSVGIKPHDTLYPDQVEAHGMFASEMANGSQAITVVITERVLPSASIKRHIAAKVKEFTEAHGQKVKASQKAEWREAFVDEMLPHCPMKETEVEVLFVKTGGYALVGTSSQRNADIVIDWLTHATHEAGYPMVFKLYRPNIQPFLNWVVANADEELLAGWSAKLVNNETKKKMSFNNDESLYRAQSVFRKENGYPDGFEFTYMTAKPDTEVVEVQLDFEGECLFSLTNKAVVKGIKYNFSEAQEAELGEAESETQYRAGTHILKAARCTDILDEIIKQANQITNEREGI